MRNCIAHGNISVSENMIFSFKDVNPNNENDIFNYDFKESELRAFVHAFAEWIMTKKVE